MNTLITVERHDRQACADGFHEIGYSFAETVFGKIVIASTRQGICCLEFVEGVDEALESLRRRFPLSTLIEAADTLHTRVTSSINSGSYRNENFALHLCGTEFQLTVWQALTGIAYGQTATYSDVARMAGHPKAVRATGTAIGLNPVSILIPCHRVIRSDGHLGNYRWGVERKQMILEREVIIRCP